MPIKSYTDDDLWGDSPSAPQSQPASTARSIDDIWESPKKYAPSPPPPLSARTIDDIWGDAENVSDLGQLNKTTEDVAGPTGLVDAFSRSVSRAAESAFQGILGARVGMGKLPSMAALKAMSVYDPDKYDEITSNPDKMRQYQNSWEGIPVVGSINVDTTNEDMYRKWIAESKGKVETELRPSKKTLESETKGTWYRDLNWWAERSPEAVTQLAAAAATNILAPGAGLVEAGTVAGGSTFLNAEERLKSRGWSEPDAALTAVGEGAIMGVLEGVLEKVPLDLITKNKFVKGRLLDTVAQKVAAAGPRFAGVAAAEATEEIASEVADMALQRVFEQDPTAFEGAGQRVAMAGALGAAAGGPMGIPATIGQVQRGRQLGELKAARPEIQEERTKAHMQEAEAMTNQLLQTEEGKKSLLELSQKPEPSRKDFEMAGYDTGRLRLNAEQRKQYAVELQQYVRQPEQPQLTPAPEPTKIEGPVPPTTPAVEAQTEAPPSPDTMQQVEEAVKETVKITGGAGVGNEKAMFGPKGLFAKGFAAAKKKLGHTTGNALTPEARQLIAGTGDKKMQREMKSSVGSSFEKFVSPAGSKKIIERAVDDVAEFMAKEGGDKFAEYYQQQSDEEAQVLRQRFPEMDPQSPAGPRMFQFYRMLNAIASAQTELSKNTEETMSAYAGVRQTGRVPVAFDEKGDPIYSLPKGDDSRFEGPIYSDINSITDTVKKLSETIDKDAMDVLLKRAPVPEGLVQLGGTYKGKPVKTYKDYLYGYFAEKYVTSEAKKGALTTSNGLVAKLVREIATTPESEFKKRVRTAFEIGGGSSQYNKAFNYQVLNDLMARPEFQTVDASGRNTPDMPRIVEWLNERVTPDELNAEKEKLGYGKIQPSTMKDIIDTVWTAEGQEATIPRTFLFGPKVGAYMLNRMADADPRNTKYNTMDVWESRFWRYINNGIPDTAAGIAEGVPRRIYMRQAREFAKVWEDKMGTPMSVSAGQAARWYLMKESAKKAGYGKAGENETIPHWTMKAIEKYMENELGQETAGDMGQTLAGVFGGKDLQELNEYEQGIREERAAIQTEKPGKATKAELAGPWTKPTKKVQKPSGQKELFPEEGPKPIPPEEAVKTTVQDIGVTPATPELAEGVTSVSFQEAAPKKIGTKKKEVKNDNQGRQEKKRDTKDTAPSRDKGKATAKAGEAKPTAAAGRKPSLAPAAEGVSDEGIKAEAPGTEIAPSRASTESVVDYEDPSTLDERESYFQQGRIDWKPNTGPQGARTGKPKPKREVVRDVLERVGIVSESYDVHTRGPGILGFYRWALTRSHIFQTTGRELWLKASELVSIGTAVHEAAHYLDQKFNLSGKVHQLTGAGVQPSPVGPGFLEGFSPAIQNSFRMLDYHVAQKGVLRPDPVSGLAEGWAEAVRLYVESADPSSVLGPDVKSTIDSLVMNNPEIAKILNATRSDVQAYLNSSDAEKVSMAMQDPSRALASPSESYFARQDRTGKSRGWYRLMAKKFQNRIKDLEDYENQLKKTFLAHWSQGAAAMTGEQAWDQVLRDSGGLASQLLLNSQNMISRNTDHAILHYIQDPLDGTNMGPSGRSAFESFESQKELDDFGRYMYAKVAMNRWVQAALEAKDYIVGETDQAVLQRVINEVESGPNAAKFAKASRDVTDYFNNLLELEVKYGLKTRGEVDAMKAKHDIYMPFFRQLEQRMSGTGGKVIGVKSGVRKLGGGSVMPVLDTYDAMIDRTNDLYSTVVRKAVETSFIKTAELSGVSGDFIRKLTAEEAENVKDVTKITTGGTTYYYKIDPDLKYALSQVNPQLSPMIADLLGIVGVPTGIAKKFMVTFNIPYFTTKNYVRDLKTSSIRGLQDITGIDTTGGAGLSPAAAKRVGIDLPRALIGLGVKMTDIEMLFERQGGTKATVVKTTRSGRRRLGIATRVAEYVNPTIGEAIANLTADQTKRRVFLGAKDRSAFQAARDFVTKAAEWTESVNDSVELAARREAFMRTLQALGKTSGAGFSVSDDGSVAGDIPQWALSRAMYNAMEITTNFNRRGEWQPLIEPVFLFYNAAIQGTAGQIMTAKNAINSPIHRKRFAMAVVLGAAAKILAMAVMYDDEDEDGVTSLEKWAEIPDYIRENNDVWVIRGHAITIPREREWGFFHRAVDSVVAQYMRGETPSAGKAAEGIKKEIGQRLPVTGGSLPTIAQLYFGKDIFRGEDIESYWDQKKLPQYRYDERTSSLAKFIGSAADYTGLSPKEVDFMIRNTFGSLGPKGTDFLTGLVTGEQGKLSSVPFLGGFMTDMIPRQSQSDYMALRNRSSMEFDEWAKNRGAVPEEAVARILDNESTIGVADHVMKSIRDNDKMDNVTKAKYITGLARWALDREPVAEYPNPLLEYYHQDIPVEVRKEILKALKEARSATVRATEDIPKGTEKYREAVKSKRRLGQKLVRPTPKEME